MCGATITRYKQTVSKIQSSPLEDSLSSRVTFITRSIGFIYTRTHIDATRSFVYYQLDATHSFVYYQLDATHSFVYYQLDPTSSLFNIKPTIESIFHLGTIGFTILDPILINPLYQATKA